MKSKTQDFDKKKLYDYLQEKYSISKLPKQFFIKMANIYKGKLQGLSKPIPPEHIYDMWVRKSKYLDNIYFRNFSRGKKMDSYVRLNYDLAILLSKYDDYLKWLDKQKALASDNQNIKENITVTSILDNKVNHQLYDENDDDLSDIIDELI